MAFMLGACFVPWLLIEARSARTLPLAPAMVAMWGVGLLGIAVVADLLPRLRDSSASPLAWPRLLAVLMPAAVAFWLIVAIMPAATTAFWWTRGAAGGAVLVIMALWHAARKTLETVPRLLVVGGPDFQAAIAIQAAAAGYLLAARANPRAPDWRVAADEALDCDVLILEQRSIARLCDVPIEVRRRVRRVFVSDSEALSSRGAGRPLCSPLPPSGEAFKRIVDVAVAGTLLILALPTLCVSALAVALDSRGGVLFRQMRVGRDGRQFTIYKLRTMTTGTSDREHQQYLASLIEGRGLAHDGVFKLVADPRMTRVGRWLRRWSIDELPQLWNVVAGSMSLVGPRPSLPREVELYTPEMLQRTRVKPGLTGLWQVSGRSRLSFDEMIALDLRYSRSWSISLEIGILMRTPLVVLTGRGAA